MNVTLSVPQYTAYAEGFGRWFCGCAALALAGAVAALSTLAAREASCAEKPAAPNVVIVYADDLGYGDLGCYGGKLAPTPNLDRMATEGVRFTSFYVAQAVCSASRTALLTGCYPNRVGILGALGPASRHGIHADETTLAEVVKPKGYATAIFGKWHLGHHPQFLPTRHGFDEYFGLPYSNDMWPFHPTAKFPPLPLFENEKIVNENVAAADQPHLTTWYTERAVAFIERNKQRPFLLYVPHAMPHVPLFVSEKFRGKSPGGTYGDVLMEIDWSVGQILGAVRRCGLDDRTLVVFASDNGPWLSYGNHAGSSGPLREGKGTSFEGGVRVPCIMRMPGRIPAGRTCDEPAATIDILPTVAELVGATLPPQRPIDGLSVWPLATGRPGAKCPHDAYYFYWDRELQAVRSGQWKLHFPHSYRTLTGEPGADGKPGPYRQAKIERALYDLSNDLGEQRDVSAANPAVVARLEALAEKARAELGDSLTKRQGSGVREPGRL